MLPYGYSAGNPAVCLTTKAAVAARWVEDGFHQPEGRPFSTMEAYCRRGVVGMRSHQPHLIASLSMNYSYRALSVWTSPELANEDLVHC